MNKSDFLDNLAQLLVELPPNIRQDVITYYDEILTAAINEGESEEEVVAQVGLTQSIANYHIAEYLLETAEKDLTTTNFFRVIRATLRLALSNLILLIIPFLGMLGLLVALGGTSFVVIVAGFVFFIGLFVQPLTILGITIPSFFYASLVISAGTFFLSIGLIAFGLLFAIGTYIALRIIYHGVLKHLRYHLITRRRR